MIKSAQQSSIQNDIKYRSMSVGAVPSSEYLIQTTIVGATPAASVEFPNLDDYHGIYRHLKLVMTTRSTKNQTNQDTLYAYINGDTGANYSWHRLYGDGSSVTSSSAANASQARIGFTPCNGASSTADGFSATVLDILDAFETTKYKTLRSLNGSATNDDAILLYSSLWQNTAAITSIEIDLLSDSFLEGSRFSLYGVTA